MPRSKSARSLRRFVHRPITVSAIAFACAATTTAQSQPRLNIVSEMGCPLLLETATMSAAPEGVSITYSIRNDEKDTVREVVITAAAINFLGEVVSLRMQPVVKKIPARRAQQFTIVFPDLELENADAVSVGIQGVRWSGNRKEWRTALRVSGPTVLAEKH